MGRQISKSEVVKMAKAKAAASKKAAQANRKDAAARIAKQKKK